MIAEIQRMVENDQIEGIRRQWERIKAAHSVSPCSGLLNKSELARQRKAVLHSVTRRYAKVNQPETGRHQKPSAKTPLRLEEAPPRGRVEPSQHRCLASGDGRYPVLTADDIR
ncbi:MAG: hypothetical protein AB7O86_06925 [Porticoccaceae bacterium]